MRLGAGVGKRKKESSKRKRAVGRTPLNASALSASLSVAALAHIGPPMAYDRSHCPCIGGAFSPLAHHTQHNATPPTPTHAMWPRQARSGSLGKAILGHALQ
jgi:hypothetical protein